MPNNVHKPDGKEEEWEVSFLHKENISTLSQSKNDSLWIVIKDKIKEWVGAWISAIVVLVIIWLGLMLLGLVKYLNYYAQ